ncbi:collagen alpha-5(vi) chain [Plakobranchus ocellatus]|uniref:Collagen alpha-5(Vi) chain n=1 Tax=Plakobranchus ocellatus TaxID=259542 RepID=A0AAV4A735_9GAST|nr:collagen alpha-5(vi) chain [Plakobranchus ocellatus]
MGVDSPIVSEITLKSAGIFPLRVYNRCPEPWDHNNSARIIWHKHAVLPELDPWPDYSLLWFMAILAIEQHMAVFSRPGHCKEFLHSSLLGKGECIANSWIS